MEAPMRQGVRDSCGVRRCGAKCRATLAALRRSVPPRQSRTCAPRAMARMRAKRFVGRTPATETAPCCSLSLPCWAPARVPAFQRDGGMHGAWTSEPRRFGIHAAPAVRSSACGTSKLPALGVRLRLARSRRETVRHEIPVPQMKNLTAPSPWDDVVGHEGPARAKPRQSELSTTVVSGKWTFQALLIKFSIVCLPHRT